MRKTYRTKIWGERVEISGDFAQASSPVVGMGGGLQVADFRHSPRAAMRRALEDLALAGGDDPDDDEDVADEIDRAISRMKTIDDDD